MLLLVLIYYFIKLSNNIPHFFTSFCHNIFWNTEKYLKLSIDNSNNAKKNRTQPRKTTTHRNKSRRISRKNNNTNRNICKSRRSKKIYWKKSIRNNNQKLNFTVPHPIA